MSVIEEGYLKAGGGLTKSQKCYKRKGYISGGTVGGASNSDPPPKILTKKVQHQSQE